MNYEDALEEAEFRLAVRSWLRENAPVEGPPDHDEGGNRYTRDWHRKLSEAGWLGVSWPTEYGGKGVDPIYDAIVNEEIGASGAPSVRGINHLARAILQFGTAAQRERFLPPMLSGESQWCQGFSEPGAGSDLVSLSTTARLDGAQYHVNGQKVWTSRAQWADWCLLLARTNTELPRHQGISCLAVEIKSPGVTVRPLKQIWGTSEFNEVFFDDLEVPVDQRIGGEGDGWRIATTVLASERSAADIGFMARFRRVLHELDELARDQGSDMSDETGNQLERGYASLEACRLHVLRTLSIRRRGVAPGPETSVDKLLMTRANQLLGLLELGMRSVSPVIGEDDETTYRYLHSRAASIYGGTEQIQRNIIAERILKMPRIRR